MVSVAQLLVLLAIIIILLRHITRNFNYWKDKKIPFVKPVAIFGNLFDVVTQKAPLGCFLQKMYESTKSPCFGFFVFDQPFLLVRSPAIIGSILIKDFEYFCDRSVTQNNRDDGIGSNILFLMKNPLWKRLRTKLTPHFTSAKVKNMVPLMEEVGDELIGYLSKTSPNVKSTEVKELSGKFTTDVISTCAFGINSYSFQHENSAFRVAARRIFSNKITRSVQMACYFFAPFLVKPFRMKILDPAATTFMREVIWQTVSEREKANTVRGDVIDAMIQIRKQQDTGLQLDGDILVAQAAMYFVAGFETTASTIMMTLYELSLNTDVQNKLREEILDTLRKYETLSYEALQGMTFLDMVISETLRMYPPIPFLDRRCNRDYHVPGTDIVIEKGIPIYISVLGIQRDPEYFPNPNVFDPERFSEQNKGSIPTYCYLPFGDGPRRCIGTRFGLLSTKLAISRILTKYQIEPTEDTPVPLIYEPKSLPLTPKGGLHLKFNPVPTENDGPT